MKTENKIQITSIIVAIALAFASAYLGYRYSSYQRNIKEENIYIKSLTIIDTNLDWQLNQLERLDSSLTLLEYASVIEGKLIIDKFPVVFETKILLNSINHLIDYEESNDSLIRLLIFYVNHIEELNFQLDFKSAMQTSESIKDKTLVNEGISNYIQEIKYNYIQKNIKEIQIAKQLITKE